MVHVQPPIGGDGPAYPAPAVFQLGKVLVVLECDVVRLPQPEVRRSVELCFGLGFAHKLPLLHFHCATAGVLHTWIIGFEHSGQNGGLSINRTSFSIRFPQ